MQTGLIHFGVVKVGMVVIDFVMAYSSLLSEKKTLRLRDLTLTATLYLGYLLFLIEYQI